MADDSYKVTWVDRRGAGRMQSFPASEHDKVCALLARLKCNATVKQDGRVVGGAWKNEGYWVWCIEQPEHATEGASL